jgi:hypothetical protein
LRSQHGSWSEVVLSNVLPRYKYFVTFSHLFNFTWFILIYLNFGKGNRTSTCVWDLSFVAYFIRTIYLMDFLYLQRGLESRPCREILYIMVHAYHACAVLCLLYVNPLEKSRPTRYRQWYFYFVLQVFLRILCTFYLSTFWFQYILLLLKSSRVIVNYFYVYSSTNSK